MKAIKIVNRSYNRDYEELETYEAGISLSGGEVKSIRDNRLKLEGSFVKIMEQGPVLINAEIAKYRFAGDKDYEPQRTRKLLFKKTELTQIKSKMQSAPGLTLVPVLCYNKGPWIKLQVALVRGRGDLEKKKREKAKEERLNQLKEAREYEKYDS